MGRLRFLALATLVLAATAIGMGGCFGGGNRVVLYCAQDREFAETVLGEFTNRTQIRVDPKFDTEADKSVSLYEELRREAQRPRCDVHWNNEILSTIRLQKEGLLAPYDSPAAAPYPDQFKAKDHTWHAFAGRARVLIVNTQKVKEADRPGSLLDLTDPRWKGQVAMAKPQFGTTATHAACLFEVLGAEPAKVFYRGLRRNDVQIVPGNKHVAVGVGLGQYAIGMTDTDDAIAEVKAGKPVVILYPDRAGHKDFPRLGTLYIPNTLAIVRNCPNPEAAKKLIDYLLSAEVEKKLAETASHQIPLNPQVKTDLPEQIVRPEAVTTMKVDFEKAAELWEEVQTFLRNEFAKP